MEITKRLKPGEEGLNRLLIFSPLKTRIPKHHPLRKLRSVVDILLTTLDAEFDALYARTGPDSIPPDRLVRASPLQVLF